MMIIIMKHIYICVCVYMYVMDWNRTERNGMYVCIFIYNALCKPFTFIYKKMWKRKRF